MYTGTDGREQFCRRSIPTLCKELKM